ncbi:MAG TPA: thermonuclease family protein [Geminicoccaceae bacterium]|nr:thermonuclease family protein [Geminicoccaceae bacterium]
MAGRASAAIAGVLAMLLRGGDAAEPLSIDGPVAVAEVRAGDLLRLADGRAVRLAGIRIPTGGGADRDVGRWAERARAELSRLLDGEEVRLARAEAAPDRYGRLVAQIKRRDGLWVQGALLEAGLAQVQTRPGEAARAEAMLEIERGARAARRGLWAEPGFAVREASAALGEIGRFGIVQGQVIRVAPTERFVYLNFGADWRSDFTVRIAKELARRLASSGLDVEGLGGRRVEIRGFVLEAGGPLIELSHPEQMQVLP